MFEFLVTTFDYNLNVFEIIGIWGFHAFCKVYFKAVRHVCHTSINEGSAKDKDINLEPHEQSRNSK